MTFTDDDLKLMKMQMYEPDQTKQFWWPEDKLKALLSRLEAGEEIAKGIEAVHPEDENCGCSMCDLLKAWRKASGK